VRATLARVGGRLTLTEPKSEKSRRTVALSAPVVAELRAHRARQAQERLAAGAAWVANDLVFPTHVGTPTDPRNAARVFESIVQRAGLSGVAGTYSATRSPRRSSALERT
jgi:hypothetical protein